MPKPSFSVRTEATGSSNPIISPCPGSIALVFEPRQPFENRKFCKAHAMKITGESHRRRVVLKGAFNFRDLGGYRTSEGTKTHWGKLFRSDNLSKLTRGDLKQIKKLNLQLVIDLRSIEERISRPNRLPMRNGIRIKNIEISDSNKSHNKLKRDIFYVKCYEWVNGKWG